ncbi:MAG: hypothetical protein QOG83_1320 [Alphaproteobacteria bacterium]|nr:hypothetical protein [Alphaproteobacteria bacterium]
MAGEIKDVNDAIPNHRASMSLLNRHGLGKRSDTAMLCFNRLFEFLWGHINHWKRHAAAANSAM